MSLGFTPASTTRSECPEETPLDHQRREGSQRPSRPRRHEPTRGEQQLAWGWWEA
jgi:hypothetical protein